MSRAFACAPSTEQTIPPAYTCSARERVILLASQLVTANNSSSSHATERAGILRALVHALRRLEFEAAPNTSSCEDVPTRIAERAVELRTTGMPAAISMACAASACDSVRPPQLCFDVAFARTNTLGAGAGGYASGFKDDSHCLATLGSAFDQDEHSIAHVDSACEEQALMTTPTACKTMYAALMFNQLFHGARPVEMDPWTDVVVHSSDEPAAKSQKVAVARGCPPGEMDGPPHAIAMSKEDAAIDWWNALESTLAPNGAY